MNKELNKAIMKWSRLHKFLKKKLLIEGSLIINKETIV